MIELSDVGFIYEKDVKNYNVSVPFNPPEKYPEFDRFKFTVDPENNIYRMIRNLFIHLNLDKENIGTASWNPFSDIVSEGQIVLIKPNFVKHFHALGIRGVLSQITHASILRPIIDYLLIALNENGRIIIADTPLEKTNFKEIIKITKVKHLINFYKDDLGFNVELYDLRSYMAIPAKDGDYLGDFLKLKGAPGGYVLIDLKDQSELSALDYKSPDYYTLADHSIKKFDVLSKKRGATNQFHSLNKHIYKIPKIVLQADAVISVPKLKTHKMAGVTLNLKNMIGICEKMYLPHHRRGYPPIGDAFHEIPSGFKISRRKLLNKVNLYVKTVFRFLKINRKSSMVNRIFALFKSKIEINEDWWGGWHGNDTLWRTIHDLNKILLYSNRMGKIMDVKQRKYFGLIDGIIGQEGEGPMSGQPKSCGLIIGGYNPITCDAFASYLMGFNIKDLRIFSNNQKEINLDIKNGRQMKVISNVKDPLSINLKFNLPMGYKNLYRI